MKKKILFVLLAVLCLVGCDNSTKEPDYYTSIVMPEWALGVWEYSEEGKGTETLTITGDNLEIYSVGGPAGEGYIDFKLLMEDGVMKITSQKTTSDSWYISYELNGIKQSITLAKKSSTAIYGTIAMNGASFSGTYTKK